MTEKEKFNHAAQLKRVGKYEEAILVFSDLLKNSKIDKSLLYLQLGGSHYSNEDFEKSLFFFQKTLSDNTSNEIASLGAYLSFIGLGKTTEAIEELNRFATKNSIDLYKDTLKELLTDLNNGYSTDFKDIILSLAEKYDISISR